MRFDTIIAPITGAPPAAVAWIRLSGPDAWQIAGQIFSPWPEEPKPRQAIYGTYASGDDGLALPFQSDHSYTGEEVVELSMHGSLASIRSAVEACLACGARMAEPGEFTQRAFLNGRIDLSQAEAVRESIKALTEAQLRQAARNRAGALRDEVLSLSGVLAHTLSALEASVDFSEEIGEFDRSKAFSDIEGVMERLKVLRGAADDARIIREGYRVAIVGNPNAGKSSLLNRILGIDRAIVTPIPGTTRDYMEERIDLGGAPVVLIDTAGLRESQDHLEQLGMERTWQQVESADDIWLVYDGSQPDFEDARQLLQTIIERGRMARLIANKADLGPTSWIGIPVSAKTGEGVDELLSAVKEHVLRYAPEIGVNPRQTIHIEEALSALVAMKEGLAKDSPDDLLSVFLRDAWTSLGKVTGDYVDEDVIDRIFHDFCVGK